VSEDRRDLIILLSGGVDSALLVELALSAGYSPSCLIFDYGQVHKVEIRKAEKICLRRNLPYRILSLPISGIRSKLSPGSEGERYPGVSEWYFPSRNLVFISVACSYAESEGITRIWYGANLEDRENRFPDCYQEWLFQVNSLLARNGSISIHVEAPLLGVRKDTIWKLAKTYGISEEETYSGYGER